MQLFNETEMSENIVYPGWQKHYREALLELDQERLQERIALAETAIASRRSEIAADSSQGEERRAIEDALSSLRVLRREII